MRIPLLENI